MKRLLFTFIIATMLGTVANAQLVPVQNQFIVNPYVYNPAWAGKSDFMQFNASFKKQWWGIEGSPSVSTVFFELPMNDRLALGGNLVNITEGPLNNLTTHFTGSYRLPLGYDDDHYLSFGMSWGIRHNSLNTSKIDDPDDPAVVQINQSNLSLDGSFGFAYKNKGLELGFSTPRMAEAQPFNEEGFNSVEMRPWYRFIGSASYRYEIGISDFAVTPTILYHYDKNFNDQIEGMVKVDYMNQYWAGGGYRQDYGIQMFAGMDINEMFSFGYFHNFGNTSLSVPNNTSELMVTIRIGTKRRNNTKKPNRENEENTEVTTNNKKKDKKEEVKPKEDEGIFKVDESISLDNYDESIEVKVTYDEAKTYGKTAEGDIFDLKPSNYVMLGEYKYMPEAKSDVESLRQKGLKPKLLYDGKDRKYYLYLIHKAKADDARRIVVSLRRIKGFEGTKLLILE